MAEKKFSWLKQFPVFAGTLVGIALTAIGGVMVLNVVLKLYVFQFDTPRYGGDYRHACVYDEFAPQVKSVVEGVEKFERKQLTATEQKKCIADRKQEEQDRYLRDKKESFVDGLAMLLVGIPFWILFNRKRKEDE